MLAVLDFSTIKNDLFPIVAAVFTKTSSLSIKIKGLEAFVILCGGDPMSSEVNTNSSSILDKYTIQEKIVPLLKGMKTKEPAVMMATLKVFRQVGRLADSDFLATDVLPLLWTLSLGPLLNLQQFKEFMDLIKQLSARIEDEQVRKLRDMVPANGLASPASSLLSPRQINDPFSPTSATSASEFEDLVLGKNTSQSYGSTTTTTITNPFAAHPGSPTSPSSLWSMNHASSTANESSRAVTPDTTFSFQSSSSALPTRSIQPPLQSSTSAISNPWASPPQTSIPSYSNNAWSSQPQSPPNTSMSGNSATWSQTSQSNTWGKSSTLQPQSPPNSTWGRPSVPQHTQSLNSLAMSGLQQPLQPTNTTQSLFNLAPPPGVGTNSNFGANNARFQQPQPQTQEKKTGLDAYPSLI
jgi:SCY1-like protein 2